MLHSVLETGAASRAQLAPTGLLHATSPPKSTWHGRSKGRLSCLNQQPQSAALQHVQSAPKTAGKPAEGSPLWQCFMSRRGHQPSTGSNVVGMGLWCEVGATDCSPLSSQALLASPPAWSVNPWHLVTADSAAPIGPRALRRCLDCVCAARRQAGGSCLTAPTPPAREPLTAQPPAAQQANTPPAGSR